jgi:alkylation response protein AidB-like acyl-CoA dehydrogenase
MLWGVKEIWTGRVAQVAGRYGESAPTAAVCCNACRACLTTNLIGVATAALGAAGYWVLRRVRRQPASGLPPP